MRATRIERLVKLMASGATLFLRCAGDDDIDNNDNDDYQKHHQCNEATIKVTVFQLLHYDWNFVSGADDDDGHVEPFLIIHSMCFVYSNSNSSAWRRA